MTEQKILELLWQPHPLGKLSWADMSSLWFLIQRDEFIKFQLLQDMKHIPRVYGFCGRFYAVEKVETLEEFSFSPFKRPMSWKKRLKTALDFLDLSDEFSNTTVGKLHHCDIQPGNFGITKNMRVVALDIDTVFPNKQMEDYLEQPTCESDKQCDFFDCVSVCNITEHQCSRNILTNNLQVSFQCAVPKKIHDHTHHMEGHRKLRRAGMGWGLSNHLKGKMKINWDFPER